MITTTPMHKFIELGRIRIGNRESNPSGRGTRPHKLTNFRLTSLNRSLLGYAAEAYGGEVQPWKDEWAPHDEHGRPTQYELYTTTNALDVLIPTYSAVSLSFEQWSASGCQRRCTGQTITHCPLQENLVGTDCTCPENDLERADLAKDGKACARILRLSVLLPDLPGVGIWRLETKGYFATAEFMGTLGMLQMAGQEHQIIEAQLRLEQRTVKRPGTGTNKGTLQFAVPVLWVKYTPRQLLAKAHQVLLAPPAVPAPVALASAIADLYGDGAIAPAGEDGAEYIARIEAAIYAQPQGKVEDWWTWAEGRLKKARTAFTVEDYQFMFGKVQEAVARHAHHALQAAPETEEERDTEISYMGTHESPQPDLWDEKGIETTTEDE